MARRTTSKTAQPVTDTSNLDLEKTEEAKEDAAKAAQDDTEGQQWAGIEKLAEAAEEVSQTIADTSGSGVSDEDFLTMLASQGEALDPDRMPVKNVGGGKRRGRAAKPNPFADRLKESYDTGKAIAFPVPGSMLRRVQNSLRNGASQMDKSAQVRIERAEDAMSGKPRVTYVLKKDEEPVGEFLVWVTVTDRKTRGPRGQSKLLAVDDTEYSSSTDDGAKIPY